MTLETPYECFELVLLPVTVDWFRKKCIAFFYMIAGDHTCTDTVPVDAISNLCNKPTISVKKNIVVKS